MKKIGDTLALQKDFTLDDLKAAVAKLAADAERAREERKRLRGFDSGRNSAAG